MPYKNSSALDHLFASNRQWAEGMVAKEELKLLKEGHTVLMPRDVEHAHIMLRVASFYLSQNDPSFKLKNFK